MNISPAWIIIGILGAVGVIIMIVSTMGIHITTLQLYLALIFMAMVFIVGVVYYLLKNRRTNLGNDNLSIAVNLVIKWAKEKKGDNLIFLKDGDAHERGFRGEKSPFVGMTLQRAPTGDQAGLPVTAVVQINPLHVVDFRDHPGPQFLADAFFQFQTKFAGGPTPNVLAEGDANMFGANRSDQRGTVVNVGSEQKKNDFDHTEE